MRNFLLPALILLEVLIAVLLVQVPAQRANLSHTKRAVGKVLGIYLAQEPSDQTPPPDNPTSEAVSEPAGDTTQPPPPESIPDITSQTSTNVIDEITQPGTEQSPQAQQLQGNNDYSQLQKEEEQMIDTNQTQEKAQEFQSALSPVQMVSILNPSEIVSSTEGISSATIEKASKEDDKLQAVNTPQEKVTLLLETTKDKVKDIDKHLQNNDFASLNFVTQRLNDQLDQVTQNLQVVEPKTSTALKASVATLCKKADLVLRYEVLSVPEDLMQDLEISRGKCQAFLQ